MRNLYEILEVPKNATSDEIKESYQRLVQEYAGKVSLLSIEMAYDILCRPNKRAEYDEGMATPKYSPDYWSQSSFSTSSSSSSSSAEDYFDTESKRFTKSTKILNLNSQTPESDSFLESISLEMFTNAMKYECDRFTKYHESRRKSLEYDRGYPQGKLSFYRHFTWSQKVDEFTLLIAKMDTLDNAVQILIEYLSNESRDYYRHSLPTYLLDGVRKLLEQVGKPGLHDDSTGHYTERDWIWVSEVNIVDTHLKSRRCL